MNLLSKSRRPSASVKIIILSFAIPFRILSYHRRHRNVVYYNNILWYTTMVWYYKYKFIIVIVRVLSARLSVCTLRPSPGRRWTRYCNYIILIFYISVHGRPIFSRCDVEDPLDVGEKEKNRFDMLCWEIANLPIIIATRARPLSSWRSTHHERHAADNRHTINIIILLFIII